MLTTRIKKKLYQPVRDAYCRYLRRQSFKKQIRPSDVFLVGHPKSGNTWLTMMLGVLIENNFSKRINLNNIGEFVPSFHNQDDQIVNYNQFPDPRLFRNEGPIYPDLYPKTIYIVRDPRAAYVSYYHHCVHDTGRVDWKIEDFIEEMLSNGCIKALEPYLLRWDRHVKEWLDRAEHQQVLFVKYEEMKQDCYQALKKAVDFIGLQCSEEDMHLAVERGDFKKHAQRRNEVWCSTLQRNQGRRWLFCAQGQD